MASMLLRVGSLALGTHVIDSIPLSALIPSPDLS